MKKVVSSLLAVVMLFCGVCNFSYATNEKVDEAITRIKKEEVERSEPTKVIIENKSIKCAATMSSCSKITKIVNGVLLSLILGTFLVKLQDLDLNSLDKHLVEFVKTVHAMHMQGRNL